MLVGFVIILSGADASAPSPLSSEQVANYRRDGFVVARGMLSAEEVALVRDAIEQDASFRSGNTTIVLNDDAGGATQLNLWSNPGNGTLGMLTRSRRILASMRMLLGGDVLHYHSKTLIKEPRAGGEWNWHQDYGYWYKDFFLLPTMATAYFAIDRQTAENGALTVLNGSHELGRIDHWTKGDQQGADVQRVMLARARYTEVQLSLAPGDVVFFDSLLLHNSPGNFSPRRRMSFASAFTRSDNEQCVSWCRSWRPTSDRYSAHPAATPAYHLFRLWSDPRCLLAMAGTSETASSTSLVGALTRYAA